MRRFRVYVEFKSEDTECKHYFSVNKIEFDFIGENYTESSVMSELSHWLELNYTDRVVDAINIYRRS